MSHEQQAQILDQLKLFGLGNGAGIVLSLAMTYIPVLNVLYARQSAATKQAIMGALIVLFGVGSALYMGLTDWGSIFMAIVAALITNQPTDRISPEPSAVKEAKQETKMQETTKVLSSTFDSRNRVS